MLLHDTLPLADYMSGVLIHILPKRQEPEALAVTISLTNIVESYGKRFFLIYLT